jgi:hypothetical protein
MMAPLVIAPRFCGPPGSGNGGYACGLVAASLGGQAEITLRAPPPLAAPMTVERAAEGSIRVLHGRTAPVARGFFLGDYEALQPSGNGFLAVYVKTNCDAPYPPSNPLCAPASSNTTPTTNTNPTDVFSVSLP